MRRIAFEVQPWGSLTEDQWVARVGEVKRYIEGLNPSCRLGVQLWLRRQTVEQIIRLFNLLPDVPILIIGGDVSGGVDTEAILREIEGR